MRPLALLLGGAFFVAWPCSAATQDKDALSEPLSESVFAAAVLARNPSVAAMREAAAAAEAREDGAGVLDDPLVSWEIAPLTLARAGPIGTTVQVRQALPMTGRLGLARSAARSDALAAASDLDALRLELAYEASLLFADLEGIDAALALNEVHQDLAREIATAVRVQYAAGKAPLVAAIDAQVQLARLEADRLVLEAERARTVARMNGLLHRDPPAAIGPISAEEPAPIRPAARPELARAAQAVEGRTTEAKLARREVVPDLMVMATYSSMWMSPEHRWMVGVGFDVPLQARARRAGIDEADAMTAMARAERDRVADDLAVEATEAAIGVESADGLLALHRDRLVPLARERLDAARVAFAASEVDFVEVLQAQRDLLGAELALIDALAERRRAMAALRRAVGSLPPGEAP